MRLSHLSSTSNPGVSTLLLGGLSSEDDSIPNLWGLSLSPEQDAAAIAERAISQGMRSAIVLQKNNEWGTRLGEAFALAFAAPYKILDFVDANLYFFLGGVFIGKLSALILFTKGAQYIKTHVSKSSRMIDKTMGSIFIIIGLIQALEYYL